MSDPDCVSLRGENAVSCYLYFFPCKLLNCVSLFDFPCSPAYLPGAPCRLPFAEPVPLRHFLLLHLGASFGFILFSLSADLGI